MYFQEKLVNLGKRVPESAGQILNLPPSKKICRINKRALGVTNLQRVTVAEGSEAFDSSRARRTKHRPLTPHTPEEAGPKVILMYSDQHAVEVRSSQETARLLGKGGVSRATTQESNQKPRSLGLCAL